MWSYEKKLQYPVHIKKCDLRMAKVIMAQLGGPDGELAASLRYMSQRYLMPSGKTKGLLTDISTEELAHVEMISAMLVQLMDGATSSQLQEAGLSGYYTQHGKAIYPSDANGIPFSAAYFQVLQRPQILCDPAAPGSPGPTEPRGPRSGPEAPQVGDGGASQNSGEGEPVLFTPPLSLPKPQGMRGLY